MTEERLELMLIVSKQLDSDMKREVMRRLTNSIDLDINQVIWLVAIAKIYMIKCL